MVEELDVFAHWCCCWESSRGVGVIGVVLDEVESWWLSLMKNKKE